MPNWCNNNISISGPADKIKKLWETANSEADDQTGLLDSMYPMPRELDIVAGSLGDDAEQEKLYLAEAANVEKFGHKNWYDWRVANWGTKWDIGTEGLEYTEHGDGTAEISGWFDSAWSPPIEAYQKFDAENDSDCYITASFHEPGMDFGGFYETGGGEEFIEGLYDQCKLKEHERDDLFRKLDEEFGIVEQFEIYEEDEDTADLSPNMS